MKDLYDVPSLKVHHLQRDPGKKKFVQRLDERGQSVAKQSEDQSSPVRTGVERVVRQC